MTYLGPKITAFFCPELAFFNDHPKARACELCYRKISSVQVRQDLRNELVLQKKLKSGGEKTDVVIFKIKFKASLLTSKLSIVSSTDSLSSEAGSTAKLDIYFWGCSRF